MFSQSHFGNLRAENSDQITHTTAVFRGKKRHQTHVLH